MEPRFLVAPAADACIVVPSLAAEVLDVKSVYTVPVVDGITTSVVANEYNNLHQLLRYLSD